MKRRLADNLKRIRRRIDETCERVDRDPSSITLVAVTKSVGPDVIRSLMELGVSEFGENRAHELAHRAAMANEWLHRRDRDANRSELPRPKWHMIGHVQRNKVGPLLPWVEMIHSVDSLRLAEEIDAQSARLERVTSIMLEVNAGGEASKTGVAVAATTHLAEQIGTLEHLRLCGLMSMAPLTEDESRIRLTFERVRDLFDEVVNARLCGPSFQDLSLGMSNDFEAGIEFGATYVRIGTALFEGVQQVSPVVRTG